MFGIEGKDFFECERTNATYTSCPYRDQEAYEVVFFTKRLGEAIPEIKTKGVPDSISVGGKPVYFESICEPFTEDWGDVT